MVLLSQVEEKMARVVSYTESMLDYAKNSEWELLVELEKDRRPLVVDLFNGEPSLPQLFEAEAVARYIKNILMLDEQTTQLCASGRSVIAGEMSQLNSHSKAAQAYSGNLG